MICALFLFVFIVLKFNCTGKYKFHVLVSSNVTQIFDLNCKWYYIVVPIHLDPSRFPSSFPKLARVIMMNGHAK